MPYTPSTLIRQVGSLLFLALLTAIISAPCGAEISPTPSGATDSLVPPEGSYLLAFSDTATGSMVNRLREGSARCGQLPWIYRHDCLSQTFRDTARLNRDRPDYKDARKILSDAAKQLESLVSQNVDKTKPKAKLGRKSYRAVTQTSRSQVSKSGRAIIRQAEARLLRAGGIQKRQDHYQRIAVAVEATELLLRSDLYQIAPKLALQRVTAWWA